MTVDSSAKSGQVRGADRRPSAVAELSKATSGTSALAAGLGTSGAVAAMLKTTDTSTWTTGLG